MLRVTIELVPYGEESEAKVIETMLIANIGGTFVKADYNAVLTDRGDVLHRAVHDFDRSSGAWALVAETIASDGYWSNAETEIHKLLKGRLP